MKHIDIDDMRVPWLDEHIERWPTSDSRLHRSARRLRNAGYRSIDIYPERLADWRGLERRYYQLKATYDALCDAYWGALRSFAAVGRARDSDGQVWMPLPGGENVDVYNDESDSMTTRSFKELYDQALPRPGRKPVVVSGMELERLHRLKERRQTALKRSGPYFVAWRMAVEERLKGFVQQQVRVDIKSIVLYRHCTFVFTNDTRQHVVTSDEYGELTWHEGTVYVDLGPP